MQGKKYIDQMKEIIERKADFIDVKRALEAVKKIAYLDRSLSDDEFGDVNNYYFAAMKKL